MSILLPSIGSAADAQQSTFSIDFDNQKSELRTFSLDGKEYRVRAFEHIVYVKNPVDTTYQQMNIYIPEVYFENGTINGYSQETAPIFFPNGVGGYMPAEPLALRGNYTPPVDRMPERGARRMMKRDAAIQYALSRGYVVASAGARGRTTQNKEGIYTGKAPADIVDLKAAVRYLKHNDKLIPGDANKIISNGTSAGGAMSVLLGATGNNADYEPYLKELGAANTSDNIFAVSAYCPITNLNHADAAYEWQFNGVNSYEKMTRGSLDYREKREAISEPLTKEQIKVSAELKALFPAYLNGLELQNELGEILKLSADGNGSFKDWVASFVIASAQQALDKGADLSTLNWLTIKKNKVTAINFEAYVHYMKRMKTPPAFDALDLSTGENQFFGTATIDRQHFTPYSFKNSTVKGTMAEAQIIKMMNPMQYIGKPDAQTTTYWRIRHGSVDKDTSLAIPVILATYLKNKGYSVNFELAWDKPHSGDYDLPELFDWMDNVCKKKP